MKKKRFFRFIRQNRLVSVIFAVVILIILIFLGLMVYNYVHYIIGNDLVVKVESNKIDFDLFEGEEGIFAVRNTAYSNPFCEVGCDSYFEDVLTNQIVYENFTLGAIGKTKEFVIRAERKNKIYRYTLVCRNKQSTFCNTEEEPVTKTLLISSKYNLSQEQAQIKSNLSERLSFAKKKICEQKNFASYIENISGEISQRFYLNNSFNFDFKGEEIVSLIEDYNFELAVVKMQDFEKTVKDNENKIVEINESVNQYNSLVENISFIKIKIENLKANPINNSDEFLTIIDDFNYNSFMFSSEKNLSKKQEIKFDYNLSLIQVSESGVIVNKSLLFNESAILLNIPYTNCSFNLEIREKCCAYTCDYCENNPANYPVVLVHGHSFNKDISAEYSLSELNQLQNALEPNYFNSGEITLFSPSRKSDILQQINVPLSFGSTYYYDAFKNSTSYISVQAKSENIDTYSIRFKTIIENAKKESGKDKVIVIAHSMGGLVVRRYIQIFGSDSVDKLILISVPNYGIEGSVRDYCSIFGSSAECEDMYFGSLFLNKLNSEQSSLKIYNLVGVGCNMNWLDGDGIVLRKNAELFGAEEFLINGTCSGLTFLHNDLIVPEKSPQVVSIINDILND